MPIKFNDSVLVNAPRNPDANKDVFVAGKSRPFLNVSEFLDSHPIVGRYIGQEVPVYRTDEYNKIDIYWFEAGTENHDLVKQTQEPPLVTLQAVTSAGNTTSNAIKITDAIGIDTDSPGVLISRPNGLGVISNIGGDLLLGSGLFTQLRLSEPNSNNQVAVFSGSVSGADAATYDQYVTLSQAGSLINEAPYQLISQKAQPLGYASLDGGGKIPVSQLPNSVMELQGDWNAATNTPTLVNGIGNPGDVWEVIAAGVVNFGAGAIAFNVGDWAVYSANGKWHKSLNSNEVTSVFGRTGTVTPQIGDYINFYAPVSGSASYIQNRTTQQPSSDFNISGTGTATNLITSTITSISGTDLSIGSGVGYSNPTNFRVGGVNLFSIRDTGMHGDNFYNRSSGGNAFLNLGVDGTKIARNQADGLPALVVEQNASGSTGDIQSWRYRGGVMASVGPTGIFTTKELVIQTTPLTGDASAEVLLRQTGTGRVTKLPQSAFAMSSGSEGYIQNQSAIIQSANFKINGIGSVGNLFVSGSVITNTLSFDPIPPTSVSPVSILTLNVGGTTEKIPYSTFAPASGSAGYINNQNALSQAGSFNINSTGTASRFNAINDIVIASTNIGVSPDSGLTIYRTADQVTNYEKLKIYGTGGSFNISSEASGTGTQRSINIVAPTTTFSNNISLSNGVVATTDLTFPILVRNTGSGRIEGLSASNFATSSALNNYVLKSGDTMTGGLSVGTTQQLGIITAIPVADASKGLVVRGFSAAQSGALIEAQTVSGAPVFTIAPNGSGTLTGNLTVNASITSLGGGINAGNSVLNGFPILRLQNTVSDWKLQGHSSNGNLQVVDGTNSSNPIQIEKTTNSNALYISANGTISTGNTTSSAQLTVTPRADNVRGLVIRPFSSTATASLLEVQTEASANVFSVNRAGNAQASGTVTSNGGTFVNNGATGSFSDIHFAEAGINRFTIRRDATNNLQIIRRDATGTATGTMVQFINATGYTSLLGDLANQSVAVTQSSSDNSTKISTTAHVQSVAALKQNLVTLTTTGAGAATFNQSTGALNIPSSNTQVAIINHVADNTAPSSPGGTSSLYTFSMPANTVSNGGEKIEFNYSGKFIGSGSKSVGIKIDNAAFVIVGDSSTAGETWVARGYVMLTSSNTYKIAYTLSDGNLNKNYVSSGTLTPGKTFTADVIDVGIQGTGVNAGDVLANSGYLKIVK